MGIRQDQCNKVCRIIDDYLANRPRERDELIVAVRTVFKEADRNTEPQRTCDNCGTPRDKCVYCIEEDKMWTPKTEPQTITMVKDHGRKQALELINLYHELKTEPQTERSE